MAKTETLCGRVVLKSEAFRTQKILETHHRRDIALGMNKLEESASLEEVVDKAPDVIDLGSGYILLFGRKENRPSYRRRDHVEKRIRNGDHRIQQGPPRPFASLTLS